LAAKEKGGKKARGQMKVSPHVAGKRAVRIKGKKNSRVRKKKVRNKKRGGGPIFFPKRKRGADSMKRQEASPELFETLEEGILSAQERHSRSRGIINSARKGRRRFQEKGRNKVSSLKSAGEERLKSGRGGRGRGYTPFGKPVFSGEKKDFRKSSRTEGGPAIFSLKEKSPSAQFRRKKRRLKEDERRKEKQKKDLKKKPRPSSIREKRRDAPEKGKEGEFQRKTGEGRRKIKLEAEVPSLVLMEMGKKDVSPQNPWGGESEEKGTMRLKEEIERIHALFGKSFGGEGKK